jgi:hypothetical protein
LRTDAALLSAEADLATVVAVEDDWDTGCTGDLG